ncbi:hypothetical protein LSAT2_023519 [Lamellibrachia satsuma]|nr:hypothetical protein LSAT2_023519 [Lamellibrachia satsuma]
MTVDVDGDLLDWLHHRHNEDIATDSPYSDCRTTKLSDNRNRGAILHMAPRAGEWWRAEPTTPCVHLTRRQRHRQRRPSDRPARKPPSRSTNPHTS